MTPSFGSGPGLKFQQLEKTKPDFAANVAALGLRVQCNHWGPINRRQAVVSAAVNDMLSQAQTTLGGQNATS